MSIREKQILFGSLLLITNKIQTIYDSALGEITVMQFMLLNMLHNAEEEYLNLNELSRLLGSTRQNIRQIVDSLQRKSFVACSKSENDRREIMVSMTEKAKRYFDEHEELGNILLERLFSQVNDDSLSATLKCFDQIFANLTLIAEERKK